MAATAVNWIETAALPRIRSILHPILSNRSAASDGPAVLDPPSNLRNMRSRYLLFLGFSALLTSCIWLIICISFYPLGMEYQVMNSMFESRWLLATLLFTGLTASCLVIWKYETLYLLCSVFSVYGCAGSIIVVIVYSVDFRKSMYMMHPPISSRMASAPRRKYLQLCACMIVLALIAFLLCVLILAKLRRLAKAYFPPVPLEYGQHRYLLCSSLLQIPFVWFSVYVAGHVISLQFSYVQQYMIQELLCALTLQALIIVQIGATRGCRSNRLELKLILILNLCQIIQEIFYTWNSYYIALYIHSSKARLAIGAKTDQYLLSVNFLDHFIRVCLAGSTCYRISGWLTDPFTCAILDRFKLSAGTRRVLVLLSLSALLLAIAHLAMDISYTLSAHVYRNLIAFTGISIFHLTVIALSMAVFLKSDRIVFLVIAFVSVLLLITSSSHGLYTYLDVSFHSVLLSHLETLGKDRRQPSYMHFMESCLALLSFILCLITGFIIFRLLHMESVHDRRDGRLKGPVRVLFLISLIQLILTLLNSLLLTLIKDEQRVFHSMLAYGVLDAMSSLVVGLTQTYITRPGNTHLQFSLLALLILLICETLTTYNYLSTKTAYIQLLVIFNRMFSGNKLLARNRLANLFPMREIALLICSHVIQLIQWALVVLSLGLTALALEFLHEQRTTFLSGPSQAINQTEANHSHAGQCQVERGHKEAEQGQQGNSYSNPAYREETNQEENSDGPLEALMEGDMGEGRVDSSVRPEEDESGRGENVETV